MNSDIIKLSLKSIKYYRKSVFYQFLIILLLCAVITGSLMTGKSVRRSLQNTAIEKLGNTGVYISSGLRYFDSKLEDRLRKLTGLEMTGLLELKGSSQGLVSQITVNNTSIYAVDSNFFSFHKIDSIKIDPGEIVINRKLATSLGVKEGDDIIIHFPEITDIPADAPFAPSQEENSSIVLKTGKIIDAGEMGNFSLSISQIPSANIFMNISDLENYNGRKYGINRLLVQRSAMSVNELNASLQKAIEPSDIGLRIRKVKSTGESEIISNRVFIDAILLDSIKKIIPQATPVITYLANRIEKDKNLNPYSFISGINSRAYNESLSENTVYINKWLANDIGAKAGDSIAMTWYAPDSLNNLVEKTSRFIVDRVIESAGVWADSMLMPDFPGISGSESCSSWDAGIPVNTKLIRDKDEEYWRKYKGTPKAFIAYETAVKLWGNNYGPATAIRFPENISTVEIRDRLSGEINPSIIGFTVNEIFNDSIEAAENSVDFGTLFLSLGFFLILAAFVLLSFAVSFYFDLKKNDVRTLYSLGFKSRLIGRILLAELLPVAFGACIIGSITGYLINIILINALNTVWRGAVQTNALIVSFDLLTIITGFCITLLLSVLFLVIKARSYLKTLRTSGTKHHSAPSAKQNIILLTASGLLTVLLFVLSLLSEKMMSLSFASGAFMLLSCMLLWRQFLINKKRRAGLSRLYYSFYPAYAVTPVLFIAAGIFAVIITAVNRKDFGSSVSDNSSGTGGYMLWMETSLPVSDDLNSPSGRIKYGLDEELSAMEFVQMKRSPGNDASCLNLNHIVAPPLLGVDPGMFISHKAFSFTKSILNDRNGNQWKALEKQPAADVIYGIADQTVLDWGLKIGIGDTLVMKAENGQPLNIIIAAGLQSSVFQGYVLISRKDFSRFFPSVSGNSVFLAGGDPTKKDFYRNNLNERFQAFGANIENTSDRLASFYEITNTYLSVFGVFGGLGMITGVAGLGFVLLRNFNRRKREFALMLSLGFTPARIRKITLSEQIIILVAGILSGVVSAIIATLHSIKGSNEIPWFYLSVIVTVIFLTGLLTLFISMRSIRSEKLISSLRAE